MKRSKVSLSHQHMKSFSMGKLIPCGLTEVLPGDTIRGATQALIRLQPMLAPVMHQVHCKIHHWFVPHRLVWDEWEDFITGGPDGMDASVFPTVTLDEFSSAPSALADHYGIKPAALGVASNLEVSALPFRGYNLIYNEWYRDQDLINEQPVSTDSGADTTTALNLLNVAWSKDYFTTARPWTQKGPDVTIPLATTAPVQQSSYLTMTGLTSGATKRMTWDNTLGVAGTTISGSMTNGENLDLNGLHADTSNLGGGINELRLAFALQRYEEARARYGSRYTEYLRYLGVKSSDSRLQRPEYLGGGKSTIQMSEVLQTAEGTDPVGEMRGHGIGSSRSNKFLRFFEEHGYLHSFISVTPVPIYPDGMDRHWLKRTKEDFFQKELQYIGQQELWSAELYAKVQAEAKEVFGYQDRYAEYRQGFSKVTGQFRDQLDFWHMARLFGAKPVLNAGFVDCVPTDRIFAQVVTENVLGMIRHSLQARRIVGPGGQSHVF